MTCSLRTWVPASVVATLLGGCSELGGLCAQREHELQQMREACPCEPDGPEPGDSGGGSATGGTGGASGGTSSASGGYDPQGDSAGQGDSACLVKEEDLSSFRCSCDPGGEEPGAGPPVATDQLSAACGANGDVTLYLSSDDSNSMSSPVQVREAVLSGWASVSAVALRPWEFLNYYSFDYPAANAGQVVIVPELTVSEALGTGRYLLQVGVSAESMTPADRPPINLTLVLDTSGSMSGTPIERLRDTCRAMASVLREGDVVSMVTWNTENAVVLDGHGVAGPDDADLLEIIADLESGGGTDLHGGLVAGYALAEKHGNPDRIDRMVLISDGGANVGITDEDLIAAKAGGENEDGIYMVGVGVGTADTYNDSLMDTVTDLGKGASVFVASEDEAWKMFADRFISTLYVAARDVQVRLDLPPGFELVTFSGEEYSSDPTEIEPQHLAPNDAMVFHQEMETCAADLVRDDTPLTVHARWKDPITFEERETSVTRTFGELLAAPTPGLLKGAAIVAYTDALAAPAPDRMKAVAAALVDLATAESVNPGDPDLAEIRAVLEAL